MAAILDKIVGPVIGAGAGGAAGHGKGKIPPWIFLAGGAALVAWLLVRGMKSGSTGVALGSPYPTISDPSLYGTQQGYATSTDIASLQAQIAALANGQLGTQPTTNPTYGPILGYRGAKTVNLFANPGDTAIAASIPSGSGVAVLGQAVPVSYAGYSDLTSMVQVQYNGQTFWAFVAELGGLLGAPHNPATTGAGGGLPALAPVRATPQLPAGRYSLPQLAQQLYGDASQWGKLARANRGNLGPHPSIATGPLVIPN